MRKARRTRIAIVLLDQPLALDVAGPAEVFALANRLGAARGADYELIFLSRSGGNVSSTSGLLLHTEPLRSIDPATVDTVIISGGGDILPSLEDAQLLAWVRRAARSSRRICSICTGAFVLGAASVLNGRTATTHWASAAEFRARFPAVKLSIDSIYVRDGKVWTSAGVTAGIDLALALVADDLDRRVALLVARYLVVFIQRPGGQSQFSSLLHAQSVAAERDDNSRLADIEAWIADHPAANLSVERLAQRVGMAPRTFARRFQMRTGMTPAKAVEAARVETARRQLEDTRAPVKSIAAACGFGDEERMRRAFIRCLGVAPSTYRERFSPQSES